MNQTKLAEKVGVNKATIVRAEQGDPKVSRDTYIKIATVLGTKLAILEMEAARLEPDPETETRHLGVPTKQPPSGEATPTKRRHTAG
jgi:DNA-binding XRE family transcriptional regulator